MSAITRLVFISVTFLWLLQILTGWTFYRALARAVTKYDDLSKRYDTDPSDFTCLGKCTSGGVFISAMDDNSTLCKTLADYRYFAVNRSSIAPHTCALYSTDKNPDSMLSWVSATAGECRWTAEGHPIADQAATLRRVRLGCVVVMAFATVFVGVMILLELWFRRDHRRGMEDMFALWFTRRFQPQTSPVIAPGVVLSRQIPCLNSSCRSLVTVGDRYCQNCGQEQSKEHHARQTRAFGWFRSFMRIANLRVLYLLLIDMPLAVFVIIYVSQVNSPRGLFCYECILDGEVCEYLAGYDSVAVWCCIGGLIVSYFSLAVQLIVVQVAVWRRKDQNHVFRVHVLGIQLFVGLFMLLSLILFPVCVASWATNLPVLLDLSPNTVYAVKAFSVLLAIPILLFFFMMCTVMGAENDCCSMLCDMSCLVDSGDCGCCDACCCCC